MFYPNCVSSSIHTYNWWWSILLYVLYVSVVVPHWYRSFRFIQFPPRTFRVLKNSWVCKTKTKSKQLPRGPTNSLTAVTKKELRQFDYSQEAGGQLPYRMPKSILSDKHAEAGPNGLTTNTIIIVARKNQAW